MPNRVLRCWTALLGFAFVLGFGCGSSSASQGIDVIDATVDNVLHDLGVPSASVAIVRDGQIYYVKAYGNACVAPVRAADAKMHYPIGSVSKQFLASLILLLQEDGKISLDDHVSKYLPNIGHADEVTVKELLSMISGYQDFWPEDYVMPSLLPAVSPDQILKIWANKPLDFAHGTQWQYSNTNYVIAGRIAEIVGGKPLMEQLQERIFKPLKMTAVIDSDSNPLPANDPVGYCRYALGPPRVAPLEGHGWMYGAGELAMPASDMALWDLGLINKSLLSSTSYKQMFTQARLKGIFGTGYGLGVFVESHQGHHVVSHDGEVSGFMSENLVFPDEKAAVAVFTNVDNSGGATRIAWLIADQILGSKPRPKSPKAPVASTRRTAVENRAYRIFQKLQNGEIDRDQLTEFCSDYFTAQALEDFATGLKPLGVPDSFTQNGDDDHRGGMIFRGFTARFGDRSLLITTFEEPNGKLEQYMVQPL